MQGSEDSSGRFPIVPVQDSGSGEGLLVLAAEIAAASGDQTESGAVGKLAREHGDEPVGAAGHHHHRRARVGQLFQAERDHVVGLHPHPARQARDDVARPDHVVELRVGEARAQRLDPDTEVGRFHRQRLRELDQEGLAGRVQRVAGRPRSDAGQRGDVDDAAGAGGVHAGQGPVAELADHIHHDLEEAGLVFPCACVVMAGDGIAGVVDQHIDGPPPGRGRIERGRGRTRLGQVGLDGNVVDTVAGGQLPTQRLQAFAPPGDQGQIVSGRGQLAGEFSADSGRGAGDQGKGSRGGGLFIPVNARVLHVHSQVKVLGCRRRHRIRQSWAHAALVGAKVDRRRGPG